MGRTLNEQIVMCSECGRREAWSRTLCQTCYKMVSRAGFIADYPTKAFLDDPESHARWLFGLEEGQGIAMIADLAIEHGYVLVEISKPSDEHEDRGDF